jgi:hypothetical protein
MPDEARADVPLDAAEVIHAHLETQFEAADGGGSGGSADPALERAYRTLGWRILAARAEGSVGSGLTVRIAALARDARTLEEYEAARDELLGPILDRLESPENRDP